MNVKEQQDYLYTIAVKNIYLQVFLHLLLCIDFYSSIPNPPRSTSTCVVIFKSFFTIQSVRYCHVCAISSGVYIPASTTIIIIISTTSSPSVCFVACGCLIICGAFRDKATHGQAVTETVHKALWMALLRGGRSRVVVRLTPKIHQYLSII